MLNLELKAKIKSGYGYKQHKSVDMGSEMINKVAITPANVIDSKGFKHVAPNQGATYTDKSYCDKNAWDVAKVRNLHLCAIKKNNMKNKNRDLDRYYTSLRAPFENVFSKLNKRTRYRGIVKNQFSVFMQAIVFNFKRLAVLTTSTPPLIATLKQGIAISSLRKITKITKKLQIKTQKNSRNLKKN